MYAAAMDNTITAVFLCLSAISVKGFLLWLLFTLVSAGKGKKQGQNIGIGHLTAKIP